MGIFHKEVEFSDSGSFLTPLKDIISESSDNEDDVTPLSSRLNQVASPEKQARPLFTRTKRKNPAVENKINRIFQNIRENQDEDSLTKS